MLIQIAIILVLVFSLTCTSVMIYQIRNERKLHVSFIEKLKLISSGILAFISDTIGVGSFAVNIALAKLLNTFPDEQLPAVNNGAQVIPGTIASLYFMKSIQMDPITLITLVVGTCIGGLLGGHIVANMKKQHIRLAMVICFALIMGLLIADQLKIMPVGGDLIALSHWKLYAGFFGMILCGALTCVGIGLFAMVQGVLFLLGVSPIIAFPIMTTAGAMQQPLTTLMFLKERKIPLQKTLILSLAGCIGVFIALPIVSHLSADWLHRLLIFIMLYNFITIGRAFLKERGAFQTPSESTLCERV